MATCDTAFSGSIPAICGHCLGPLLFEPYAALAAERAVQRFEGSEQPMSALFVTATR